MPWLNSAHSKPRERISRSMARPSLWRGEFQQVEKEYMAVKKKAGRSLGPHSAVRVYKASHVSIAGAQHGGKPGRLHLSAPPFAGLLEMPVVAHFFQSAFAVDLFLQAPQRLVNRLAFFQSYFGQELSLPL